MRGLTTSLDRHEKSSQGELNSYTRNVKIMRQRENVKEMESLGEKVDFL